MASGRKNVTFETPGFTETKELGRGIGEVVNRKFMYRLTGATRLRASRYAQARHFDSALRASLRMTRENAGAQGTSAQTLEKLS
jgi:hypothetical protein